MNILTSEYFWLFLGVFLLTVLLERLWIPFMRRRRLGQPILEIGPSWHAGKAGTPTMGGVGFLLAVLVVYGVFSAIFLWHGEGERVLPVALIVLFALFCGLVGVADDVCKLRRKENQGLTAPQKYLLQLLSAALFLFFARASGLLNTAVRLPFEAKILELGVFYYPLALLFLTGVVNALNLTDGLDGLLSATVAILAAFYVLYGIGTGKTILALTGAMMLGAAVGFLVFNAHPARVFMGDTGSLFLGGFVAGAGLLSAEPLTTLMAGGVYVVEAASVILQVLYFKCTDGRRLFRMAPLHHHFEKCGWSENRIVTLFALATVAFSALAFWGGWM